jgi:hypothetical protein
VSDRFVVRVQAGAEAEARQALQRFGSLEPGAEPDEWVLHLQAEAENLRQVWEEVLATVRSLKWMAPVLADSAGTAMVPVGDVTVRFHEAPSSETLQTLCDRFDVAIAKRNEFVPEQVAFRPAKPRDTFLPDLVAELEQDKGVLKAWATTRSAYRRR